MRRAAIFTRVSTDRQTTENQLQRLREVAARAGWHLVDVYEEVVSGAAARGRRAAYDRMLKDATRRRFEVLLAWDVSRLGRSLRELLECFETLRRTGVDLYLDQQASTRRRQRVVHCSAWRAFLRSSNDRCSSNGRVPGSTARELRASGSVGQSRPTT